MTELMNTKEVAKYLRIKERKVYDLVRAREIPCTRVTGKWLFPKYLVDQWLIDGMASVTTHASQPMTSRTHPAVITGSHDPLLDWAVRESGCDLALLSCGSLDGLERFALDEALACGLHVRDAASGSYNVVAVRQAGNVSDAVLIEWARREQGLIVAPGNPLGLGSARDLLAKGVRVVLRQDGAGSRILFEHLLAEAGLELDGLQTLPGAARTESDLALAICEGKADTGLAVAAAARAARLDFVPLTQERFDLLVRRRAYFDDPFQKLLAFARSPALCARAQEMGGYDVAGLGRIAWNGR